MILFGATGVITTKGPIEVRMTKAGRPWCGFSMMTGEGDNRQYIRVSVFDPELAQRLGKAGDLADVGIAVQGSGLRINVYEDAKGEKRYGLQGVASRVERVELAGKKTKKADTAPADNPTSPPADKPAASSTPADDSIPF